MMSEKEFHYYNLFLQNSLIRRTYRIKLNDERILEGVPTAGSLLDPTSPDRTFSMQLDDGVLQIPLSAVVEAEELAKDVSG